MAGRDVVFEAWDTLSGVMNSWRTHSSEDLSGWIPRQRFVQPRWGAHFSGRVQEGTLTARGLTDGVSALETVFVRVALHACPQTLFVEVAETLVRKRRRQPLIDLYTR